MSKNLDIFKDSILINLDIQIDRIKLAFVEMLKQREEFQTKASDLQSRKGQISRLLEGTRSQEIVL